MLWLLIVILAILFVFAEWVYLRFIRFRVCICPYPSGKSFAFTIIDDTDCATLESIKPIYDLLCDLNMRITKTIWVYPPDAEVKDRKHLGDTLARSDYLAYLRQLEAKGFEIALHNVSSLSNKRNKVEQGLEEFKAAFGRYPSINVSHEKNKENLYQDDVGGGFFHSPFKTAAFSGLFALVKKRDCSATPPKVRRFGGHMECSEYFWGDLCKDKIEYYRSYYFFEDVNTLKVNPKIPYHVESKPYVNFWFDSSNGQDCEVFNGLLTEKSLRALKKECGCCILYTHFGKGFTFKSNGAFHLNRETKNKLMSLARDEQGWFVPVSILLGRLQEIHNIRLIKHKGSFIVKNDNRSAVENLAIHIHPSQMCFDLDGKPFSPDKNGAIRIDCLKAGEVKFFLVREPKNINQKDIYWTEQDLPVFWVDLQTFWGKLWSKIVSKLAT